jgi:hypothetical protein
MCVVVGTCPGTSLDFGSFKETVVRQTAVFVWMKTKKQGRNA